MRFDRRQFIHLGTIGALGTLGGCQKKEQDQSPPTTQSGGQTQAERTVASELQVDFEGLYIIEGNGANTKMHMLDGPLLGLPTHTLQLQAMKSALDTSPGKTATPDAAHIMTIGGDERWLWDLKGFPVSMPKADSGPDILTSDDTSAEDGQTTPTTEPGWHSLKRVPDLKEICGATKVTDFSKVASTVSLKHGHLTVLEPTGVGKTAVWKFVKTSNGSDLTPPGQKSLSNKVRYIRKNNGAQLVIEIGTGAASTKIFFKPGVTMQAKITNLMPPSAAGCPAPCTPNMNHFSKFLLVVDKAFDASASFVSFTAPPSGLVEPDYCPGSRV